jgi:hypothetical protein
MADSGKQSPLGVNVLSSLLQNTGLWMNPVMYNHVGAAISETGYTLGTMCNDTCIRLLTYAINDAFVRGVVDSTTYSKLITIGAGMIPALGNSKPTTFVWAGPANTGDPTSEAAQVRSWIPYSLANPYPDITSWGYIRLLALQARHEANYNDTFKQTGEYKDFLSSFMMSYSFVEYSNSAITSVQNSKTFQDGTYSNMNDLISADVLGVNLSAQSFGLDLIDIGKAIDLSSIDSFGLPSKLLLSQKYNAITPSLSLALLSAGLSQAEINTILALGTPSVEQETKIYGAFTIIAGQDLVDILVPLNCKIALNTLADLLNVKKMFPRSYSSMTVPVYNATFSNANSKIYYPIYVGSALNPNLTSAPVMSAVGTVVPTSMPPVVTSVTNPVFTPQEPFIGFGSYLFTILPTDIGIAAGAFSVAMLQIKNILSVPIEKFAQAVVNLESTNGLSVNGTSVPTHLPLATAGSDLIALGSGPQGTFTMSNFFGCMSGLPYNVTRIQNIMSMVRDVPYEAAAGGESLYDIYKELYLAVTWEQALGTATIETQSVPVTVGYYVPPTYDPDPPYGELTPGYWVPSTYLRQYRVRSISTTNQGGGYGRGMAPAPTASFNYNGSPSCGASALFPIGTDKNDVVSFGRGTLTSFDGGSWTDYPNSTPVNAADGELGPPTMTPYPIVTIEIQAPPTALPTIPQAVPMTNTIYGTSGWPGMNSIIWANSAPRTYINQANAEIAALRTRFPLQSTELNTLWDDTGTQLTREQRARSIGIPPVPVPRNTWMSMFPTTHYSFVDSIPRYALNTNPNMYAQTLEAISNMTTVGGQSIVAMMRQERNQARLAAVGIPLDNNIPVMPSLTEQSSLLANGSDGGSSMSYMNQEISTTGIIDAIATASVIAGGVVGVIINNPGAGYTTPPDVIFTPTGVQPSGATATANVLAGSITTIDVVTPGIDYLVAPIVNIVAVDLGEGATAHASVDPITGEVTGIIVDTVGTGYLAPPIVNLIPVETVTGATATAVIDPKTGSVVNVIVDTPGAGYATSPIVTFTGGVSTTTVSPSADGVYNPTNNTYYITNPLIVTALGTGGTGAGGTGAGGTGAGGTGAGGTGAGGTGAGGTGGNGNNISGQSQAVDTGGAVEPGSLAGSPYSNLIPPNLNTLYTSGILLPASQTPTEAIGEVTVNNCDCWT